MAPFSGFSLVLKELRLMHKQPSYRFILMYLLVARLVGFVGVSLLIALLVALHRFGLL